MSGAVLRTQPLLLIAAATALGLAVTLAAELRQGAGLVPPSHLAASPAGTVMRGVTPPDGAPTDTTVDAWSRTVLERPLFSPSRRPATVHVAGPDRPRLAGIVLGPAGARALFAGSGGGRGIVAAVGDRAGSWRVLSIDSSGVRVEGPDGPHVLHPARDASGAGGGAAGTAGPAPAGVASLLDMLRARMATPAGADHPSAQPQDTPQ